MGRTSATCLSREKYLDMPSLTVKKECEQGYNQCGFEQ